tara:strand:- start:36316 stop:37209 length:894 start_codon:yes stop_codon:yes gene_type:complete
MSSRIGKPQELEIVGGEAPGDWLAEYAGTEDKSLDSMQEYRILPRIKQIQGTTSDELVDQFGEGSVVVMPGPIEICKKGGAFTFVPIFMWTEFWKMSSLRDQQSPMVLEKTKDKTSSLSVKARQSDSRNFYYELSEDSTSKEVKDPGKGWKKDGDGGVYTGRYVEVLIFAIVITTPGHDLAGTGCTISFMKGEFTTGRNFCNAIGMRKVSTANGPCQAPLWSTQWEASPTRRTRGKDQKWWGLDIRNPESPYIDPKDVPFYKGMYDEISLLHSKDAVGMDTSDMEEESEQNSASSKF